MVAMMVARSAGVWAALRVVHWVGQMVVQTVAMWVDQSAGATADYLVEKTVVSMVVMMVARSAGVWAA